MTIASIPFNDCQQKAFYPLARFCLGKTWEPDVEEVDKLYQIVDKYKLIVLNGYAGTGKTWLINRLVEYVREINPAIKFAMTAPTNKAVKVLRKTSECAGELGFGTIHHYLGLKESVDDATGERKFVPDKFRNGTLPILKVNVLILDEVSQLNKDLFQFLGQFTANGLKIIFMGDDRQIPPVGEVLAKPLAKNLHVHYGIYPLYLNTPMRQAADNPILQYAYAIRDQYKRSSVNYDFAGQDHGETGIEVLATDKAVLEPIIEKYFCGKEFAADSDYMKMICWRNSTAAYMNDLVRTHLFKQPKPPKIMKGEKLIADGPIFIKVEGNYDIAYTTNEELTVMSVETDTEYVKYTLDGDTDQRQSFAVYRVKVTDGVRREFITVIHESSEQAFSTFKKRLIAAARGQRDDYTRVKLWKQFYGLEKRFHPVAYNYCLTAHKAQGSSYDYTMVHEWDIKVNSNIEERNQILYVGVTRARNKLFIIKR